MSQNLQVIETAREIAVETVVAGKTFWQQFNELNERIIAESEQARRQAKRERRRALCGHKLAMHFDVHNGSFKKNSINCDLWRDDFCPRCKKLRAEKFTSQMLTAAKEETFIRQFSMTAEEFKRKFRKIPKSDYKCFPQEDGSVVVFVRENKFGSMGTRLYDQCIKDLDWSTIVNTPRGKRVSGNLGTGQQKEENYIRVPWMVANTNDDEEKQKAIEKKALKLTFEETKDLNPQTVKELQEAVTLRSDTFLRHYEELDGKLLLKTKTRLVPCLLDRINWKKEYGLNDIETMVKDPVIWAKGCFYTDTTY